jgi:hypothetical protein
MSRIGWRHVCAWLGMIAIVGCKSKPANPEELLAARSLGVGYLERNRLPEAEEQFKLVSLAPKDPFGYANLGLTYPASRFPEAETQLRRARELTLRMRTWAACCKLYAVTNRRAERARHSRNCSAHSHATPRCSTPSPRSMRRTTAPA